MKPCGAIIDPSIFTATHCCEYHAIAYQQAMAYMHNWYPPRAKMFGVATFTMAKDLILEQMQQVFTAYYTISLVELSAHQEMIHNEQKEQKPQQPTRTSTNRAKVSPMSRRPRKVGQ